MEEVPNEVRVRPFLRRDDEVLRGMKLNPEMDLFKRVRRQRIPGVARNGFNSVKTKVVMQEPWTGDPDEEFHWHDRRRKQRSEPVK